MDVLWQQVLTLTDRPLDVILINKAAYHSISERDKAKAVTRRILTHTYPRLKSARRRWKRNKYDSRHVFHDSSGGMHRYHPSLLVAYVLGYLSPAIHVAVVRALVDAGVKHVDVALQMAAGLGKVDICEVLLREAKANPHHGESASLRLAAARGHADVVSLLLSHGVYVHAKDDEALLRASYYGYVDVIRLLIEAGARTLRAKIVTTALRRACSAGHTEAMSLLLQTGADASDLGVLNWALALYRTGPLETLLKHGLDPAFAFGKVRRPEVRRRHVCLLVEWVPDIKGLRIA